MKDNTENLLHTIPFPFRVQTSAPFSLLFESSSAVFDTPRYGDANLNFWESIDEEGWRTCRAGYAVYVRRLPSSGNRFVVLHGMKVKGHWTQRGKSAGLSVVLDANRIEAYVNNFLSRFADCQSSIDDEVDVRVRALATENVHEIRSMNTSLYHVGFELQEKLHYDDKYKLALAKNVVALSELVSARIELADLTSANLGNPAGQFTAPLSVYKKFDKIIKCYIAYAAKREITINLSGDSRSLTRGIEHFEMIPLVIIDNAVKYSPDKRSIDVAFSETAREIVCRVRSLGPKIELDEYNTIFGREVRGQHAVGSGQSGSGIGLYFARQLLHSIHAEVSVAQEPEALAAKGKTYYWTTFVLVFENYQTRA